MGSLFISTLTPFQTITPAGTSLNCFKIVVVQWCNRLTFQLEQSGLILFRDLLTIDIFIQVMKLKYVLTLDFNYKQIMDIYKLEVLVPIASFS